ncbi:MAG: hypothetical protein IJK73_04295 [Bacteroidales bacterium]|nr:hypothetical protein [Bacteroidales bacterium]
MKLVRNIFLRLSLLAFIVILPSCGSLRKVKDIKVTSCGVESYSLKGLRSVNAVLALGIDNPAMAFKVTKLDGILKYKGEDFAFYTADTLDVERQCVKVYDLPCTATLSQGISLMQVLQIANNGLEGFTTDIEAKVKLKNGAGKTLRFKDLDLQKIASQQ